MGLVPSEFTTHTGAERTKRNHKKVVEGGGGGARWLIQERSRTIDQNNQTDNISDQLVLLLNQQQPFTDVPAPPHVILNIFCWYRRGRRSAYITSPTRSDWSDYPLASIDSFFCAC